jgi:putative transposase
MAAENPRWGYTRIQGRAEELGPRRARSTVAKVLKDNGIPPAPDRPSSWRTFLRAHWGAIAGADFFTSEVWTPSRADHLLHALRDRSPKPTGPGGGLDPHPGCPVHGARRASPDGCGRWISGRPSDPHLRADRADARPSAECQRLRGALRALDPGGSIASSCLESAGCSAPWTGSRTDHGERNYQGLGNALILPDLDPSRGPRVRCRERLGGLLRYYHRAA